MTKSKKHELSPKRSHGYQKSSSYIKKCKQQTEDSENDWNILFPSLLFHYTLNNKMFEIVIVKESNEKVKVHPNRK
jgi:hypothetical protein